MSTGKLVSSEGLNSLQKALETIISDAPYTAAASVLAEKLKVSGLVLSEREQASLAAHLKSGSKKKFSLDRETGANRAIEVSITPEDLAEIEKKVDRFSAAMPELIENQTNFAANLILKSLKKRWPKEQRLQRKETKEFRDRLSLRWAPSLGTLQMILTMAREVGANVRRQTSSKSFAHSTHLIDVQTRLHARACQVTDEILCLLQSGFSEGALARWRTLHEIAVVSDVILEGGEEIAKRYVVHHSIETLRAAEEYQRLHRRLGFKPISVSKMRTISEDAAKAKALYGKAFSSQYGWAADLLNMQRPTFVDLEKRANSDQYRSHYKWASEGVHAGSKGIFKPEPRIGRHKVMLAGPSNGGLADPGHATALSLGRITANAASLNPIFDMDVSIKMLRVLIDEAGRQFLACHRELMKDERLHPNG